MNRYKRFWPVKVLFFLIAVAAFLIVAGWIVMVLWNLILPDVVGVRQISWWQALGILVLSRLLFGSWGRFGRRHLDHRKTMWRNKWKEMNDEERAAFKARWREKCGQKGGE